MNTKFIYLIVSLILLIPLFASSVFCKKLQKNEEKLCKLEKAANDGFSRVNQDEKYKHIKLFEDFEDKDIDTNEERSDASFLSVELYIMSHCPYGTDALENLLKIKSYISGLLEIKVHFIVSMGKNGKLKSIHGTNELLEDEVWAIIQKEYPKKLYSFVDCRVEENFKENPLLCAEKNGISAKKISKKISEGEGTRLLLKDYSKVNKQNVRASPTMFISGKKYDGTFSSRDIFRYICDNILMLNLSKMPENFIKMCEKVPRCFSDSDCFSGAEKGKCVDRGMSDAKCIFDSIAAIPLYILESEHVLFPRIDLEENTINFFPSVDIHHVFSEEARGLINKHNIDVLPAYIFGKEIKNAQNFSEFSDGLIWFKNKFIYDSQKIKANFFHKRKVDRGTVNIFISPLARMSYENLRVLKTEENNGKIKLKINYFVITDPQGNPWTPGGNIGIEEICRQKALKEIYPLLYWKYLSERDKTLHTSYWEESFKKIDVNPEKIKEMAVSKNEEYVKTEQKKSNELGIREEGVFLLNNQELVIINDRVKFQKMLLKIISQKS